MSTFVNSPKAKVKAFRKSHGDPLNWDAVDFEVHQNLAACAAWVRRERLRRPVRRTAMVALLVYAIPLYLVAYTASTLGRDVVLLERHLDQVDDLLGRVEQKAVSAGDTDFLWRFGIVSDQLTDAVDQIAQYVNVRLSAR